MTDLIEVGPGRIVAERWAALYAVWRTEDHPHFRPEEFACTCANDGQFGRCRGRAVYDVAGVRLLEALRQALGAPVRLTSATRCPVHNAAVGGAPRSQHRALGLMAPVAEANPWAVDISLIGHDRMGLFATLRELGHAQLGYRPSFGFARSFVHLDLRPGRAWFYSQRGRDTWAKSGLTFA